MISIKYIPKVINGLIINKSHELESSFLFCLKLSLFLAYKYTLRDQLYCISKNIVLKVVGLAKKKRKWRRKKRRKRRRRKCLKK